MPATPYAATGDALRPRGLGLLLSADALRRAQRSGTTLADLAAQKGVSKDDLLETIAADMKANEPERAPARTCGRC